MAQVRTCVYSLVLFVLFQRTFATPTFGSGLLCTFFCDYDDDSSSSSRDIEDYIYSFLFGGDDSSEETSKPAAKPGTPAGSDGLPQQVSLSIPPTNGVNLTVQSSGNSLLFNLLPWLGGSSATTAAPITAAPATPANGTAANATKA